MFDTDYYRLFCFLTDSVFYVLFAYFDESMSSIGGYEPQRSWNTVDITPIMSSQQYLSGDLFSYTNGAHEDFLLSFVL